MDKKKILIGGGIAAAVLVTVVAAVALTGRSKKADEAKDKLAQDAQSGIILRESNSAGNTSAGTGGNILNLSDEDAADIEDAVREGLLSSINGVDYDDSDIDALCTKIRDIVLNQVNTKGLNLTEPQKEYLVDGIQAITLSTMLDSLQKSGEAKPETIDKLTKAINDRIASVNKNLATQSASALNDMSTMEYLLATMSTENDNSEELKAAKNELAELKKQLETVEKNGGGSLSDADLKKITSAISSLESRVNAVSNNNSQGSVDSATLNALKSDISALSNAINNNQNLATKDNLLTYKTYLEQIDQNLQTAVTGNTVKLAELANQVELLSDQLATSVATLTAQQNDTEKIISNVTKQLADSSELNDKIQSAVNGMQSDIYRVINTTNDAVTYKMNDLTAALNGVSGRVTVLEDEILTIKNDNTQLANAAAALRDQIGAIDVDGSMDALRSELNNLLDNNTADLNKLFNGLSDAQAKIASEMETADDEQKRKLQEMKSQVDAAMEALNTQYGNEIATMQAALDELKRKNERLTTTAAALQSQLDAIDVDGSVDALRNELNNLINSNAADLGSLVAGLEDAQTQIQNKMQTADDEQKAQLEALSADIQDELDAINERYGNELATIEARIKGNLETSVTNINNTTNLLDQHISNLEETYNNFATTVDENFTKLGQAIDNMAKMYYGQMDDGTPVLYIVGVPPVEDTSSSTTPDPATTPDPTTTPDPGTSGSSGTDGGSGGANGS